jgi:nucleoside-diphosphate-sugar epimerase
MKWPDERDLEDQLSNPSPKTIDILKEVPGDIIILGAGGKMGPTLAMLLKKAGPARKIYAVSRFSDPAVKARLESAEIEIIEANLADERSYSYLPQVENVYFLAGMKFGATGNEPEVWAMNTYVPALAARYFSQSRIVALSTGNVYPFVDIRSKGATEETQPDPVGEYAQSCLGRERIFQYFSTLNQTKTVLIRLNYANEPRYGIIVDLTRKILQGEPVGLGTGYVNLIWQGEANDYIARSITLASTPASILNVTGRETISLRNLAQQIGKRVGRKPEFSSQEAPTALLSNAGKCFELFGIPQTSLQTMISVIADWVASGKEILDKPTKYEVRDGKF